MSFPPGITFFPVIQNRLGFKVISEKHGGFIVNVIDTTVEGKDSAMKRGVGVGGGPTHERHVHASENLSKHFGIHECFLRKTHA